MDKGLNPTAASLLGLLHDGPLAGGELLDAAKRRLGGFWSITRSQVYRELQLMRSKGYVRAGKVGKRKLLPFSITANGKKAFKEWMAQNSLDDTIRVPAGLHAAFHQLVEPAALAERINAEIDKRNAAIEGLRVTYTELAADGEENIDPVVLLSMMFSLKFEHLVGEWLAEFATVLAGPAPDSAYEVDVPVTLKEQADVS